MSVITQIPEWPLRTSGDQNDFSQKVEAVFGSMPALIAELNAYASSLNASLNATSVSSINIGTGSKTFAVSAGLGFLPGMPLYAASAASPNNRMLGYVTSYDDDTGVLVIDVQSASGSGTFNSWVIALGFELMKKASDSEAVAGSDDYAYMTSLKTRKSIASFVAGRNCIINGDFVVNQDAVTGTVTLPSGVYGHDMWKAGASGCTYTFATVNGKTTLTITAGSLQQIIPSTNLPSGTKTMVMSWEGTAQGKIGAGSYSNSGVTSSVTGGSNLTIEFNAGTLANVQLEEGAIPSAFELVKASVVLSLCREFYIQLSTYPLGITLDATNLYSGQIQFPVRMRANPTLVGTSNFSVDAGSAGNPQIKDVSRDGVVLRNSLSNWTPGTYVRFTGALSARL